MSESPAWEIGRQITIRVYDLIADPNRVDPPAAEVEGPNVALAVLRLQTEIGGTLPTLAAALLYRAPDLTSIAIARDGEHCLLEIDAA